MKKTCSAVFVTLLVGIFSSTKSYAEIGLQFSHTHKINDKIDNDSVSIFFLQPQFVIKFHPNVEMLNELNFGRAEGGGQGYIIGVNEVFRIKFSGDNVVKVEDEKIFKTRSSPFLELGVGINYFGPHKSIPEVSGPMQYTVVVGVGYLFKPKNSTMSYFGGYRVTHYSNADTATPNYGLNMHTLLLGFRF